MPTSFGNVAKEFLYQKTKYSEPYSFISLMGGLLDIIFFSGGFSQWQVGEDVKKSHWLKSPSSSVLHNVTLPFLSSPMNILSRYSINTYWGRWVLTLPCCLILLDLGATVLPQMLSPSLALPCLGLAFLQLNWRLAAVSQRVWLRNAWGLGK